MSNIYKQNPESKTLGERLEKRRILVTGAAGFIGSHLVDYLLAQGHEIWSVDDLSGGYTENVHQNSHFVKLDLRQRSKTEKLIRLVKPEIVFHLAADATEGRSQFTPIECTGRNYMAYLNVLVPAIKKGMDKMVVFSSMSVYGAQKPPFHEGMEPVPEDVYAISKAAMEQSTKILSKVHGFKYTILRPHNVYGPRQNMADPYRNVIAIFMNCLLRNKPFYIYGDGEQTRSFSYIDDQIPPIAKTGFDEKTDGETINVGPVKEHTVNELARVLLNEVTEMDHLKPIFLPSRPMEVKHAFCTNEKAVRLLGYEDRVELKEGMRRMWEWAKAKGPQEPKYMDKLELQTKHTPETWSKKLI